MAKRKTFTSKFKAKVVLELLGGDSSQTEPCRRHHHSEGLPKSSTASMEYSFRSMDG